MGTLGETEVCTKSVHRAETIAENEQILCTVACGVFDERCRDSDGSAFGASSGREKCRGVSWSLAATHRATETTFDGENLICRHILLLCDCYY